MKRSSVVFIDSTAWLAILDENNINHKLAREYYEKLLDQTIERALDALEERALAVGYDAVVGLRLSHPVITDGAIEIVASGTGVWIDHST